MKDTWLYRRGDIYLVNLGNRFGSEQGGCRPVLIIQNNVGNYYAPTLIVAPITSRHFKKAKQPTHVALVGVDNLTSPSVVLMEQILTIDKSRVIKYIGKVSDEQIRFAPCGIGTGSDLCPDGDRRILHIFVVAAGFEV